MQKDKVTIVEKILNANDQFAAENMQVFNDHKILAINIMASPGSGKTSLILNTIDRITDKYMLAVIEGDTAPVTIDADKVNKKGIPAVQINTGGDCHLDALMVRKGMQALDLQNLDLVIIENVGNLICPATFNLGTHFNVVVASVPEGDDKPYKYPNIYRGIQSLVLNKIDLLPYVEFDMGYFSNGIKALNPDAEFFPLSCKTGDGMQPWINWLTGKIESRN